MAPLLTAGIGSGLRAMLPSAHGITFFVNQGRPYSRGRIRLASSDPLELPLVDPAYLNDPRDLPLLIDGIERVRQIAVTEAFRGVGARELRRGPAVRARAELTANFRARAGNHFHVAGTCRIGRSTSDSVVDPRLSVHGIDALRVADASVMPAPLAANTAAPVIMIAERAAEFADGSG